MSDTTSSGGTSAVTNFGSGDGDIPAAIGGGASAGPSVGAGTATGPVASVNTAGLELPGLPAQYSTAGGLGFFTRQMEVAPTSVAVGPDGALYVGELSGLPYPEGYARVLRIADPEATTGFDGKIPSGVVETYASGFSQINGLSFDGKGNLYVLEFVNGGNIYNPSLAPGELPPSQLIRVAPDGVRTTISGPELKLGNYVFADKQTGDVYVSINNADIENGQVLRYRVDEATGKAASVEVIADGLNNPRGLAFGPDGRLYVNEQGLGTPGDSPDAATAPNVPFIPGLVSERGGFTASITRVDTDGSGDQERVLTGLPSIREYNPVTGEDRVISVGSNGFTIAPDGSAYVASGGGLSQATADALGPFGGFVRGILRVEGLFDGDPSDATITPTFDSVRYAAENGPDGSTTLFNNQSNLNDVVVRDGKLYTVDAARNVVYGFEENGDQAAPESVTAIQKRPPVLTPPQFAAVVAAGGDPSDDYRVEIAERTFKNASGAPDTPGRAAAAANPAAAGATLGAPPPGAPGAPPGANAPADASAVNAPATAPANAAPANAPANASAAVAPANAAADASAPNASANVSANATANAPADASVADATANAPADASVADAPANAPANASSVPPATPAASASANAAVAPSDAAAALPSAPPPGALGAPPSATANASGAPSDATATSRGEDAAVGAANAAAAAGLPGDLPPLDPAFPGPIDPTSPPILAGNVYTPYFDPFFGGSYAPASPKVLPAGENGNTYTVSRVYSFGDRLVDDGGTFGAASVAQAAGAPPPNASPLYYKGGFSDGPNWTGELAKILGARQGEEDTNFGYVLATARVIENPLDPFQVQTKLTNFQGQIDEFERAYGSFKANDLVTVTFGGNDLTLPSGVSPEEGIELSVEAIVDGLDRMADLGAKHFLVTTLPNIELAPLFKDPAFLEQLGAGPGTFEPLADAFNDRLKAALDEFEDEKGLDVEVLETDRLFDAIAADPLAYGFLNVDQPVLAAPPLVPGTPTVYNPAIVGQDPAVQHATLFIDPFFHPTALGHAIIAETARNELLFA